MSVVCLMDWLSALYEYRLAGVGSLASALSALCLGLVVWMHDRKSKTNRAFFLITLTGAIWLFTFGWVLMSRSDATALFWFRMDYGLAVPFISPCVYLFAVRLRGEDARRAYVPHMFVIAAAFSSVALTIPDQLVSFAPVEPFGKFNRFRTDNLVGLWFIGLLLPFFITVAFAALGKLIAQARAATTPIERRRARNFIVAFVVGYADRAREEAF